MKKVLAIIALLLHVSAFAWLGEEVVNGVEWSYTVSNGKASVGGKSCWSTAISTLTEGRICIPSSLGGYPVTSIGACAFRECTMLRSVTIPDSVTSIGNEAFNYCSSIWDVTIPNGVTSIGSSAFSHCISLRRVTIGNGVTSIGMYAFSGCRELTSVTIPDSVTSIGGSAFDGCSGLTSVTIPDSVTSIGWGAFHGCSGLRSVTIPDSVTSIGNEAFEGCSNLEIASLPRHLERDIQTRWPFYGCHNDFVVTYRDPEYRVTFNANGGSVSPETKTVTGGAVGALPTPTRSGYLFNGWFTAASGGTMIDSSAAVSGNVTYYAQWKINQYSVTFNANGGIGGKTVTLNYGAKLTAPKVTRTGYAFVGWSPAVPATVPANNATYTAQWKKNGSGGSDGGDEPSTPTTYTVTYRAGASGSGSQQTATKTKDVALQLKGAIFTRIGYTQTGWATSDGGAKAYGLGASYSANAAISLYPVWTVNQYRVTFNANGGTGGKTMTLNYGTKLTAPKVTRTGYTFVGWSPAVPATVPASNVKYTAQWKANGGDSLADGLVAYYPFDGNANDMSGNGNNGTAYGVASTTDRNGKANGAYYFGSGKYIQVAANSQLNGISDFTMSVWMRVDSWYGSWIPIMSKGTGATGTRQYGLELTNRGYLSGYDYESCFEIGRRDGNEIFTDVTIPLGVWIHIAVTRGNGVARAYLNGVEVGSANSIVEVQYNTENLDIGRDKPGKTEYLYGAMDEMRLYNRVLSAAEVKALYVNGAEGQEPMKYTMIFNANGGTGGKTITLNYGAELTAPIVTRTGYTFVGWSPAVPATVPANNATYTAQWKQNQDPVPMPEPEEVHGLYEDVEGVALLTAASEYNGYLYDDKGAVKGTIQVKVGKSNAKTGLATIKATVVIGTKKVTLKAADKGKAVLSSDGPTELELVGGEECWVMFGSEGLSGYYGTYEIDGARNLFASKDKSELAAVNGILAKWQGSFMVIWDGGTLSVSVAAKGKVKVSGTLANGTKVTANTVLLVGEEWSCISVAAQKANLAFVLWLSHDGKTIEAEGLGDDVRVGLPGTLASGATFQIDAAEFAAVFGQTMLPYFPNGVAVKQSGTKWTLPKAGKVVYKNGAVDASKLGENPCGLKLTYKAKDGTFKGSFKVYTEVKGKPKATTVNVTGFMLNGVGYGTATVKGKGSIAITIE